MIPNPAFSNLSTQVQEAFKRNNAPGMVVPNAPLGSPVPKTNPFKWMDTGYAGPQIGAPGYTTTFNALGTTGLGKNNANPLDINKWGAGLWAAGIDPNDPNLGFRLWEFNQAKQGKDPDYQKRVAEQVSKHGWDLNTQSGLAEAVDWYYRDLSRRMDKSSNFFDSTIGKIISMTAPLALGGAGGLLGLSSAAAGGIGAATGATLGGLQGGPLGAVLGGLGGYGSGLLGSSLATNGITGTINNAISGVKDLFGGSGGFVNPNALGVSGANLYNPASLGGAVSASNGLGLSGGLLSPTVSNGLGLASGLASSLYTPGSLSGVQMVNGVPIQDGPTNPPIPGPAANQTTPPGILEAAGDLISSYAPDIASFAGKQLVSNALEGILSPASAEAASGGMLGGQAWGGKFKPFESGYIKSKKGLKKRGIVSDITGVRG